MEVFRNSKIIATLPASLLLNTVYENEKKKKKNYSMKGNLIYFGLYSYYVFHIYNQKLIQNSIHFSEPIENFNLILH